MTAKLRGRTTASPVTRRGKMLFFGKWSSWKTRIAIQFPRPFLVDAEGGAIEPQYQDTLINKSGGMYFGPEEGASDPDVILEQVRALSTAKHEYRTLIVDSVSKVTDTLRAREQGRLGDKDQWGASKKPAVAWVRQLVMAADKLDMTVILIAHEIPEWGTEGGERKELGKVGDVGWDKVPYELNATLRFMRAGKQRRIFVDKSRIEDLEEGSWIDLQRDGVDVGYSELAKRIGGIQALEAASVPIEFASEEQVAEILRLQGIVNLPPKEIERWFNAAKVERWEDLTSEQAAKAIGAFRAKVEKQSNG